jgi:hypothetical protein
VSGLDHGRVNHTADVTSLTTLSPHHYISTSSGRDWGPHKAETFALRVLRREKGKEGTDGDWYGCVYGELCDTDK